jgi:hypothetical protein
VWCVPVIHPAYTFRQPTMLGPLSAHVNGFVSRLVRGFPPEPLIYRDATISQFQWFMTQVLRRKLDVAVDVETMAPRGAREEWGLLPSYAMLRAFGVGADFNGRRANGTAFEGVGLSWFWPAPSPVWKMFKEVCADVGISKVFCNGIAYDVPLLKRYQVVCR